MRFYLLFILSYKGLPTTNNLVEVWHGASGADAKKNLTTVKTVILLRKEQSLTEQNFIKASMGDIVFRKPTKAEQQKQENIKRIIMSYKKEGLIDHLRGLAIWAK